MPIDITREWHNLETQDVLAALNSSGSGLSQEEAQRRLAEFGPNELVEKEKVSAWAIFLEQFKSFPIIVLLVAVVLSAGLGWVPNAASWIGDFVHSLSECGGFCRLYHCWSFWQSLHQPV